MTATPSLSTFSLALHRPDRMVINAPMSSFEVAVAAADSLVRGGGFVTIRTEPGGKLVYAVNYDGEIIDADRGSPADLHRWSA